MISSSFTLCPPSLPKTDVLYLSDSIQFASAQVACMSIYVVTDTPSQSKSDKSAGHVSATVRFTTSSPQQRSEQASPTATTKQTSAPTTQPPAPKKRLFVPIHVVELGETTGELEVASDTTFAQLRELVSLQLAFVCSLSVLVVVITLTPRHKACSV